jgi:hypothetical protein
VHEKTAQHTRAGAAVFAIQHGLVLADRNDEREQL